MSVRSLAAALISVLIGAACAGCASGSGQRQRPSFHFGLLITTTVPPPQPLPSGSQSPNPCHLLTAAEVAATIGAVVDEPASSRLATDADAGRGCWWQVTGRNAGVTLVVLTAKALAAARAIEKQPPPGYPPEPRSIQAVFVQAQPTPYEDLRVAGHPATYWHDASIQGYLRVNTGAALVGVNVAGSDIPHDAATLTKLVVLALSRVASTGP